MVTKLGDTIVKFGDASLMVCVTKSTVDETSVTFANTTVPIRYVCVTVGATCHGQ